MCRSVDCLTVYIKVCKQLYSMLNCRLFYKYSDVVCQILNALFYTLQFCCLDIVGVCTRLFIFPAYITCLLYTRLKCDDNCSYAPPRRCPRSQVSQPLHGHIFYCFCIQTIRGDNVNNRNILLSA